MAGIYHPKNVTVHHNAICTDLKRKNGGFSVSYLKGKETYTFTARFLIGADGANSIARRTFYPDKKIRNYVSIQQWFLETHPNPFYSCIFDPETTDCCSWSISKDHQFIFGGAFPMDNARQRFERQKEKLEKIGFRFGKPLKTEACLVLRPSSFHDFCKGEKGIFFIGEAAGFISPSSLEGISSAIYSARDLSHVLNHPYGDLNRRYWNKTLKIRMKLFMKLLKCPFMYNSFLRKLVLKSGLQSIKINGTVKSVKNPVFSAKK